METYVSEGHKISPFFVWSRCCSSLG